MSTPCNKPAPPAPSTSPDSVTCASCGRECAWCGDGPRSVGRREHEAAIADAELAARAER